MYTLINGLGTKWRPFATFFAVAGLIGTLCVMQANQLVESVTTVFTTPAGIPNTLMLRFLMGVVIAVVVGIVMALIAPLVPEIYNTTPMVKRLAAELLFVSAAMMRQKRFCG